MADQEQLDILKQGVQTWNEWRLKHHDLFFPDLSGANLDGADLSGANLINAYLGDANLRKANLRETDLSSADLRGALQLHFQADQHQVQEEGKQAT